MNWNCFTGSFNKLFGHCSTTGWVQQVVEPIGPHIPRKVANGDLSRRLRLEVFPKALLDIPGKHPMKMAERTGLEPATPGVTGRYSNQLNYRSDVQEMVGVAGVEPATYGL